MAVPGRPLGILGGRWWFLGCHSVGPWGFLGGPWEVLGGSSWSEALEVQKFLLESGGVLAGPLGDFGLLGWSLDPTQGVPMLIFVGFTSALSTQDVFYLFCDF